MDEFARRVHPGARPALRIEPKHHIFCPRRRVAPDVLVVPGRVKQVVVVPEPSVLHPRRRPVHAGGESAREPCVRRRAAGRHVEAHSERHAGIRGKSSARIYVWGEDAVGIVEALELQPVVEMHGAHPAKELEVVARVQNRPVGIRIDSGAPLRHGHPFVEVLQPADAVRSPVERLHPLGDRCRRHEFSARHARRLSRERRPALRRVYCGAPAVALHRERRAPPGLVDAVLDGHTALGMEVHKELARHGLGVLRRLALETEHDDVSPGRRRRLAVSAA